MAAPSPIKKIPTKLDFRQNPSKWPNLAGTLKPQEYNLIVKSHVTPDIFIRFVGGLGRHWLGLSNQLLVSILGMPSARVKQYQCQANKLKEDARIGGILKKCRGAFL